MRVAVVQDGPEYLNLEKTLDKTIGYMEEASRQGAALVVFGECWLSGYPIWLDVCSDVNVWESPAVKKVWKAMYNSSVDVEGSEVQTLKEASRRTGLTAVIGINEKVSKGPGRGTLYNALLVITPDQGVVNHHRKLVPTYTERLVHGWGDAMGLKAVDTAFGRMGALICWEHWMPLSRQTMHNSGEDIHVALWPMVKEMNHVSSRHYAFEGRCVVLAVGQVLHRDELPAELGLSASINLPDSGLILRGGSAVYDSSGKFIVPQVYDERKLILADLDLSACIEDRMNLDVSGHYQRDDVFELTIARKRRKE